MLQGIWDFGHGSRLLRAGKCKQQAGQDRGIYAMVDGDMPQRTLGHAGLPGIGGVLYHCDAAALLDGLQARGAVVQHSAQHDSDRARAMPQRCRAEQRIDGWSRMVFLGTTHQPQSRSVHQQVMIGRRNVDAARHDRLAIAGIGRRQAAGGLKQLRQEAAVPADVQHHKHRGGQLVRQLLCQPDEDRKTPAEPPTTITFMSRPLERAQTVAAACGK